MKRSMQITSEGLEKLKDELDHLWRVERPETTKKVAWAASSLATGQKMQIIIIIKSDCVKSTDVFYIYANA